MFDIGFWEIAIIGVLALIIVGPDKLPGLARTVGAYVGKARQMVASVKADIKRELREHELADLDRIKREVSSTAEELQQAGKNLKDTLQEPKTPASSAQPAEPAPALTRASPEPDRRPRPTPGLERATR